MDVINKKNYRAKWGHDANVERDERTNKRYELARDRTRESANWSGREPWRQSSPPVTHIDFSQPITSTEEEGNRKKGNEEAFSSDQSAMAFTEGEEIEPKTVKDAECQTIEFDYMFQTSRTFFDTDVSLLHWVTIYGNTNCCIRARLLTHHTANTVAQQISRVLLLCLWNLD